MQTLGYAVGATVLGTLVASTGCSSGIECAASAIPTGIVVEVFPWAHAHPSFRFGEACYQKLCQRVTPRRGTRFTSSRVAQPLTITLYGAHRQVQVKWSAQLIPAYFSRAPECGGSGYAAIVSVTSTSVLHVTPGAIQNAVESHH